MDKDYKAKKLNGKIAELKSLYLEDQTIKTNTQDKENQMQSFIKTLENNSGFNLSWGYGVHTGDYELNIGSLTEEQCIELLRKINESN